MRLISLRFNNFRQFYGLSPKIIFAHGDRNITVIHGCNGAGKTALLNAFTWTLFDSLTPGFLLPDQIVNKRAIREAKEGEIVDALVEIEFEHDERRYIVKRKAQVHRTSREPGYRVLGSQYPTLQWSGLDGKLHTEEHVFDVIGRILPKELHTYFFFDGERIERIVKPTEKERKEIGKATKMLLGIEIFSRATNHLDSVRREIEKELTKIGDAETVRLYELKQEKEQNLEEIENRQEEIIRNIEAQETRKKEIGGRLRQLKEVEAIQKHRDQLNRDKEVRKESFDQGRKNLASAISSFGYTLFLQEPIEKFRGIVRSLVERDLLPADVKMQFIERLLERELCICKRELKPDSEQRKAVEDWKKFAGQSDVERKMIRMDGEVLKISHSLPEDLERLDQIQQKRESDRMELSRIEVELYEIKEKFQNSPREEERDLQLQLNQVEEAIRDLLLEQGENKQQIKDLNDAINDLVQKINQHEAKEERQRITQKRAKAANESARRISQIQELFEADFRRGLQKKISKLFGTISPTPYVPELREDYSLHLLESAGGSALPVAASQGESQILSLSFIGSVMELAREYYAKKERLPAPDTSTYPVVMDSPFGTLDPIYRHQIAEHLPILADQVVLLVTKTQWRGEVEQSMAKYMGRSYVFTYYSPKDDVAVDSIGIEGTGWELIKCSPNDFEYTEIREVPHARP